MKTEFLIIGGTEKSGTTSLFEYFCNHPELNSSIKKETDYLRTQDANLHDYIKCFEADEGKRFFEASPGYLSEYESVIENVVKLNLDCKFIFILRDPIERLYSSFNFHKSKLYIPEELDINDYVHMCLDYEKDRLSLNDSIFDNSWFLNVLNAGKYDKALRKFEDCRIDFKVIDFRSLRQDMPSVVSSICKYFNIDNSYFENYEFHKANSTIKVKNKSLHKFGMVLNSRLEKFFRRNPKLKQKLLILYKLINSDAVEDKKLNEENYNLLKLYYRDTYKYCFDLAKEKEAINIKWNNFYES